jgi:hypothetical protein
MFDLIFEATGGLPKRARQQDAAYPLCGHILFLRKPKEEIRRKSEWKNARTGDDSRKNSDIISSENEDSLRWWFFEGFE